MNMIAIWIIIGVLAAMVVFLLLACVMLNAKLQALNICQRHHNETMKDISEYIQTDVKMMKQINDYLVELSKHTPYLLALEEAMKQEENGKV